MQHAGIIDASMPEAPLNGILSRILSTVDASSRIFHLE